MLLFVDFEYGKNRLYSRGYLRADLESGIAPVPIRHAGNSLLSVLSWLLSLLVSRCYSAPPVVKNVKVSAAKARLLAVLSLHLSAISASVRNRPQAN
jgi:hypothetical protein